jgi:hypothetical protein
LVILSATAISAGLANPGIEVEVAAAPGKLGIGVEVIWASK